ncbi:YadA-like family protein [Variovorax sp. CCNWLW186]
MQGALTAQTAGTTAYSSSTINGNTYNYAGGTPVGVVSVGGVGAERRVQNVAAGLIGTGSTDAINGSQLYALTTKVDAGATHYYSVNDNSVQGGNYDNDGATGLNSIAAGVAATAAGDRAIAMGNSARANGDTDVSIGNTAGSINSTGANTSVGNGAGTNTTGAGNTALGADSGVLMAGNFNIAVGGASGNVLTGDNNVAIGSYAGTNVTANDTVAIGSNARATIDNAVALGSGSVASTASGIAGYVPPPGDAAQIAAINATTGTRGAVSVGDAANGIFRQITGVAAGTADSDAVNVAQLKAVNATIAVASNKWITGSQTTSYVAPVASGTESTAVGSGASVSANNSVAVGTGATATTANSVALGNSSTTGTAVATPSVTIRGDTYNFAGAAPVGVVSVGSAGQERQITNVAAGQISATSTDAINGSQLYATNQAINNIAIGGAGIKYFHANSAAADSNAAGAESVAIGPQAVSQGAGSIAVGNSSVATAANGVALGAGSTADRAGMAGGTELFSNTAVGSTQGAVSVGSAGNERQITNVAGGTQATDAVNVRQLQAVQAGGVKYDTNADGSVNYNNVTLGNNTGPTTIHNVAPGVAGNDAVNVNQLNSGIAGANAYTDSRVNQLRGDIKGAAKDASAGTAGAMAMAGMPQAYIPGKSMLAAGVAGYDGQAALAIGVSKLSDNGRWIVKFSGSANSRGKVGVSAGAGFHW